MNLLPCNIRMRLALQPRIRSWCLAACAAAVAGCGWFFCELEHLNRDRAALAALENRALPLQQLARDRDRIQRKLAEISSRESVLAHLDADRTPLAYVALVSRAAEATGGRLRVGKMHVQTAPMETALPPAPTSGPAAPKARPQQAPAARTQTEILLQGAAVDDLAVAAFVHGLRDSGAFQNVELNSSREAAVLQGVVRLYEVKCIRH